MFHNDIKEILWGHVQRSGKSYMIAGTIIHDSKNKNYTNYLVITTVPNETISEYIHVFNCCQLSDVSVVNLGNCHSKPQNKKKYYYLF